MRRMVNINTIVKKPKLYFEKELTNESSINVELKDGYYLIELHTADVNNIAFLKVCEENINISGFTMFNLGVVGTAPGFYHYDKLGQLLEIYDNAESNITVNGHIDIYKF